MDLTNLYLEPKELGGQHGKPSDCDEETFLLGKSPCPGRRLADLWGRWKKRPGGWRRVTGGWSSRSLKWVSCNEGAGWRLKPLGGEESVRIEALDERLEVGVECSPTPPPSLDRLTTE